MPFENLNIILKCCINHRKSLFLHYIPKSSLLHITQSWYLKYDVSTKNFAALFMIGDCMLQLSASPSMPSKVAYTFVLYEAVRCKSYLSSIPKSVIVNVSF